MRTSVLLALVVLVPALMYALFQGYRHFFVPKVAHLLGMVSYWVLLLAISLAFLGKTGLRGALSSRAAPDALLWVLLVVPVVLAFGFGPFVKRIPSVTPMVFLLSAVLALVNASLEELFWRGVYVDSFSGPWLAWLVPAIGFAIWHFAPLSVIPYKKGSVLFVLSAFLLGLCWGFVAFKMKSIEWTIASHVLVDFSGFGATFYLSK